MAQVFLDTVKLYYEESKAAREQAEGLLEKYRTNTSTLLALASATVAFFGFSTGPRQLVFYWISIGFYLMAVAISFLIFKPIPMKLNGQRPSLPVRQLQSRRLGPRDGREGFVPIVAENFAQGGTKAICIDRESLLQLGRYNSYITIAEAAEYLQIGGHTHVSAHGAATMPVLIHQMNQQAPMSGW